MNAKLLICLLLLPISALAQGFAGLGTTADGFAVPVRGAPFSFPADHGPHPKYRIEWWYVTANLEDADGNDYGVQWTLFRSALAPQDGEGWSTPQLWMGHAALTTAEEHHFAERFGRGGIGQAGATPEPFEAWIDEWAIESLGESEDAFDVLRMTASAEDFAYDLNLSANGPLIFHGDRGYSVKSADGQASNYYSQPFYEVAGTLPLPDGEVEVTGSAWLDREYSSQPLSESQTGWDWFSLHFESGERLMAFQLRDREGEAFTSGTWILPDGRTEALKPGEAVVSPLGSEDVAGRDVPVRWRVEVAERGVDIETTPLNPQSWNGSVFAYWEGPIFVTGSHTGRGYLEMTGYQ